MAPAQEGSTCCFNRFDVAGQRQPALLELAQLVANGFEAPAEFGQLGRRRRAGQAAFQGRFLGLELGHFPLGLLQLTLERLGARAQLLALLRILLALLLRA